MSSLVHGLPPGELARLLLRQHRQSGADVRVGELTPTNVARPVAAIRCGAAVDVALAHRAMDIRIGAEGKEEKVNVILGNQLERGMIRDTEQANFDLPNVDEVNHPIRTNLPCTVRMVKTSC